MADTVDLNEIEEFFEDDESLRTKAQALAKLWNKARRVVVFTGAGLSTAAKIPDFRGPEGVWTRKAQGREAPACISMEAAQPTYSHKCLVSLLGSGKVDYIVSQNVDGLHRRSGVKEAEISELHGNSFLEVCWKCDAEYLRDYDVSRGRSTRLACRECRQRVPYFCHCTSRKCGKCGARLKDSIIHFKENLPEKALTRAYKRARKADLVVVVGSSLRVSPACDIPMESIRRGGKLAVINLQATPYDDECSVRLFSRIDETFALLMPLLGFPDSSATPTESKTDDTQSKTDDTPVATEKEVLEAASAPGPTSTATPEVTTAAPAPPAMPPLVLGNTHRIDPTDSSRHIWRLFVRSVGASTPASDLISSVTYELHPTFTPSTVTVSEGPDFGLERIGWGTFPVKATVQCTPAAGGGTIHMRPHMLRFDVRVSETPASASS